MINNRGPTLIKLKQLSYEGLINTTKISCQDDIPDSESPAKVKIWNTLFRK